MTVNEMLNLTPRQVKRIFSNPTELAKTVSSMRSVARKRYEREVNIDISSPAVADLKKVTKRNLNSGRVTKAELFPTVRNMSKQDLQREYYKYKNYLNDRTSTSKGLNEFYNEVRHNMGLDVKLTQKQMSQLLDIWNKVRHNTVILEDNEKYNDTLTEIATQLKDGVDPDEVLRNISDKLNIEYEQREVEYNEQRSLKHLF